MARSLRASTLLLGFAAACGGGADPAPPAVPGEVATPGSAIEEPAAEHATVRGRFLTADGAPHAGVRVDVVEAAWGVAVDPDQEWDPADPDAWKHFRQFTAADGSFFFAIRPADYHRIALVANAEGCARSRSEWYPSELAPGSTTDLGDHTLLHAGAISANIIHGDGSAFDYQKTTLHVTPVVPWDHPAAIEERLVARDYHTGRFVIEGLPPIEVKLDVHAEVGVHVDGPVVQVRPGETVTMDIVSDATNTVVGFEVEALGVAWHADVMPVFELVAANGEVHAPSVVRGSSVLFLRHPPGTYRVRTNDPRFLPWEQDPMPLASTVSMQPRGSSALEVEVVDDATGEPIEEYRLELTNCDQDFRGGLVVDTRRGRQGGREEDLSTIASGRYYGVAQAGWYPTKHLGFITLAPHETQSIEVRMGGGPVLRGRVRSAQDRPVVDARVELELTDEEEARFSPAGFGLPFCETNEEGEFRIDGIPPATYTLRIEGERSEVSSNPITVGDNETVEGLNFVLPEGEGTLAGRIVWPAGVEVPSIALRAGTTERPARMASCLVSSADPAFRLEPVPDGDPLLRLELEENTAFPFRGHTAACFTRSRNLGRFEVRPGEETVVEIDGTPHVPGFLALRVHRAGTPLPGQEVRVLGLGDVFSEGGVAEVGRDGTLRYGPLWPGEYIVVVRDHEGNWDRLHPEPIVLAPGAVVPCDIDVAGRKGSLVCLRAGTDQPWENARVEFLPALPEGAARIVPDWNRLRTDAAGALHLELAPGEYLLRRVLSRGGDGAPWTEAVTITWTEIGPDPDVVCLD